jgi:phasin family protein
MGLAGTKKGEISMSQKPKTGTPVRAARKSAAAAVDSVPTDTAATEISDMVPTTAATETRPVEAVADAAPEPFVPESFVADVEAMPEAVETPEELDVSFAEVQPAAVTALSEPAAVEAAPPSSVADEPEPMPAPQSAAPIIPAEGLIPVVAKEAMTFASLFYPKKPHTMRGLNTMTMMKSTEDFVAFGQANVEAFVKSGQIWSAGVQELTKQFATTAKASFEESVTTFKAISTCKSVKEALEMQSDFAKTALEKAMSESNKIADASLKLTEETLAPITARMTVAAETFGKAA